jgi:hypothetical protein
VYNRRRPESLNGNPGLPLETALRRAGFKVKVRGVQRDSDQRRAAFSYQVPHVEEWTDESILENSQAVVRFRRPFPRGCDRMARSLYLSGYDRDIRNSTQAIEAASDDVRRAAGYSQRGRAYSEKARYCRAFKLIPANEYGRLFSLAISDRQQSSSSPVT